MGIFRLFPYSNYHDMNMDWVIKEVKRLSEEWAETHTEWEGFKEWIENYFNTLDLTQEVQDIIDLMISSGQFVTLLATASQPEIDAWLAANITNPSSPPLDSSFLLDNAAARSSAVGWIASANQNKMIFADHVKVETNITATQDKETGTVTFVGNAPSNKSFYIYGTDDDTQPISFVAEAGHTYTLSGCPEGGSLSTYDLDLRSTLGGAIKYADFGYGITFTPAVTETLYPHIRIAAGNGNDLVFNPQIEEGSIVTPFVPEVHKSAKDTIARGFINTIDKRVNTILSNGYTINRMLDVCKSYIDHNDDLTYGQKTAIHWYVGGNDETANVLYGNNPPVPADVKEIDCSTLALLLLQGVPYEMSRYAVNDNYMGYAGYSWDVYNGDKTAREAHTGELTLTYKMAKYFYDHGIGRLVDEDGIGNLKPGDLLFFSSDGHDLHAWMDIDHCEVLLDIKDNYRTDIDHPVLVTMNCSGGRPRAVEVTNRYPNFYDGTSQSHRKLVYVVSPELPVLRSLNNVIYCDPHSNVLQNIPVNIDAGKCIKVVFDGTINVANQHFTLYSGADAIEVTRNITADMVGKKIRYEMTFSINTSTITGDMDTLAIRCTTDTTAKIENVYISDGVNI